jgi:hypothetical protein
VRFLASMSCACTNQIERLISCFLPNSTIYNRCATNDSRKRIFYGSSGRTQVRTRGFVGGYGRGIAVSGYRARGWVAQIDAKDKQGR